MFTYAPTPQTESLMMFLFLLQLCNLTLSIADLKNAFCQSDSLDRFAGPLFVEPCEGLDLPSGSLIQLSSRSVEFFREKDEDDWEVEVGAVCNPQT